MGETEKKKAKRITMAIEFTPELMIRLKAAAKQDERPVGYVVRKACEYWLEFAPEAQPPKELTLEERQEKERTHREFAAFRVAAKRIREQFGREMSDEEAAKILAEVRKEQST